MSRLFTKRAALTVLNVLGVVAVATLVAVEPAAAQIPDFGAAGSELANVLSGLFRVLQLAIVAAALVFGFMNFFKASRGGDSKGWINGLLLFIVAGFALAPETFLGLVGMDAVGQAVADILNGTWSP